MPGCGPKPVRFFGRRVFLPGMPALPEEDLFREARNPENLRVVNERCLLRSQDGHCVVLVSGINLAQYASSDRMAEAHAMVSLVEQGWANQIEVARAFACSARTVRRHQQRFEEGGLAALGHTDGYPAALARPFMDCAPACLRSCSWRCGASNARRASKNIRPKTWDGCWDWIAHPKSKRCGANWPAWPPPDAPLNSVKFWPSNGWPCAERLWVSSTPTVTCGFITGSTCCPRPTWPGCAFPCPPLRITGSTIVLATRCSWSPPKPTPVW